jgi:hypothetical protein
MTASVSVTEVDIFGSAYVSIDYARPSMEGQFQGRIDGGSASVAVAGEGQVTWFMDPTMMSLQGNLKVAVNSWIGGAEMEGGLFLGIGVPKEKAWILQVSSPHYGLSTNLLPQTLTGIYAYGRAAFGINFYIFGGGIELYAGMGAFLDFPPGQNSVFNTTGFPLPYFFGRGGFYLHGEILGGLVSAEGWATLQLYGPVPLYFEGQLGLRGCILWVLCASVSVTAGISSEGFYLE